MWIRPGFEVYWRGPGESQIGMDPRCALLLEGLQDAEQRLLEQLPKFGDVAELRMYARELGVAKDRVEDLMQRLHTAGYVLDGRRPGVHPTLVTDPDEEYWERASLAGHERRAERSGAVVAIDGLDPLGLRLGCALVDAGVGALVLDDERQVHQDDVGGGLYRSGDIGRGRQDTAMSVLRTIDPMVRIGVGPRTTADVVVMVQTGVVDPVAYRDLMRQDVCHLPVLVRELDVMIGPLVRPGQGVCLRCLDLHRCDRDPRWPAVATQAATRGTPAAETSLVWAGAALAAHQLLAVVDGRDTAIEDASLEVSAWDPVPVRRQWRPHPHCGCAPGALMAEAG